MIVNMKEEKSVMIPQKHKNLANSLNNLRKARGLSLSEFSKELGLPKSTLQSILEDGQTTLNTAIRISERLGIPVDALTSETLSVTQFKILDGLLLRLNWYDQLPSHKQEAVRDHMYALIQLIQESQSAD